MNEQSSTTKQLVDEAGAAELLSCSKRSIRRWSESGYMPKPVKIGRSKRWCVKTIEKWIDDGCPRIRSRR